MLIVYGVMELFVCFLLIVVVYFWMRVMELLFLDSVISWGFIIWFRIYWKCLNCLWRWWKGIDDIFFWDVLLCILSRRCLYVFDYFWWLIFFGGFWLLDLKEYFIGSICCFDSILVVKLNWLFGDWMFESICSNCLYCRLVDCFFWWFNGGFREEIGIFWLGIVRLYVYFFCCMFLVLKKIGFVFNLKYLINCGKKVFKILLGIVFRDRLFFDLLKFVDKVLRWLGLLCLYVS